MPVFQLMNAMKHYLTYLLAAFIPLLTSAYEGVLEYRIDSGDREWRMLCQVKGPYLRAEVYLGTTHFQTILQNDEGLLLLDELNKQIFQADFEREKWGKPGEPERKRRTEGDYELIESFERSGLGGDIFSIRSGRRDYWIEVAEGVGSMPGIFLDQFSSLSGLSEDGQFLFESHPGMPVRIYRKGRAKQPLLELVSHRAEAVDAGTFEVGEGYIRAKMRFRMR